MFEELSKCLCVNLVAYDYRGYGQSKFKVKGEGQGERAGEGDFKCRGVEAKGGGFTTYELSEQSVNEDLETIYAFVCLEKGISPENVYLFGRSLGTSPSTHLASILTCLTPKLNIAKLANPMHIRLFERIRKWSAKAETRTTLLGGLLLQSPLRSALKTKFDIGVDFFSKMSDDAEDSFDMFATERHITSIECPLFIVHGEKDRLVPAKHGKYLYKIATMARDARWQLREKKLQVRMSEERVALTTTTTITTRIIASARNPNFVRTRFSRRSLRRRRRAS